MRSFHFLLNSSSGQRALAPGLRVARLLRDAGAEVALTRTSSAEQGRLLAADAVAGGAVVVAVGGDGTVGSLAGTVVRGGGTLGIVPAGRGNDFARQLAVPKDPTVLARVLLDGPVRSVDVIEVAGRIVAGSVYAGIDSLVSDLVNTARLVPRRLHYPYASVRAILKHRPTAYAVTVDGIRHAVLAHTVVVANSGFYGSGMHVAPSASTDDGVLDIVVIGAMTRRRLLWALRRLYDGSNVALPEVTVLTGGVVVIESTAGVTAYGDGERLVPLPVTVRVLPGALNVLG